MRHPTGAVCQNCSVPLHLTQGGPSSEVFRPAKPAKVIAGLEAPQGSEPAELIAGARLSWSRRESFREIEQGKLDKTRRPSGTGRTRAASTASGRAMVFKRESEP